MQGGVPRDLTPGDADVPLFSLGGPDGFAFSPNSRYIAYRDPQQSGLGCKVYEDLMKETDYALALGYIDPNRMGAAGARWLADAPQSL